MPSHRGFPVAPSSWFRQFDVIVSASPGKEGLWSKFEASFLNGNRVQLRDFSRTIECAADPFAERKLRDMPLAWSVVAVIFVMIRQPDYLLDRKQLSVFLFFVASVRERLAYDSRHISPLGTAWIAAQRAERSLHSWFIVHRDAHCQFWKTPDICRTVKIGSFS